MKRADGIRVKDAEPMYLVACHLMRERNDALNMIEVDIPVEPMSAYIRKKHKEGFRTSHLTLIIAAYLRVAAEYKKLNYFVVNKNVYFRNEITVGMVVLKPGETDGTMNKMHLDFHDTVFDVERKLDKYVEENRQSGDTNKTDDVVRKLLSFPGFLRVGANLFRFMDKHGLLPKSLIDASPFHCSFVISNLASIRTNHIFHHCYNFGTTSVLVTMGNLKEIPVRGEKEIRFVRSIPLGIVMDERICSGSYFAAAFQRMKQYLNNPALLEEPLPFELFSK